MLEAGNYDGAVAAFTKLGEFKDSVTRISDARYREAEELLAAEKYREAAIAFVKVGEFKDAVTQSTALWNSFAVRDSVAAGSNHTVALRADGTVIAAGNNNDGQRNVGDWADIVAVAAGSRHTVGLRADGTLVAVGFNKNGQCDASDWTDTKVPKR